MRRGPRPAAKLCRRPFVQRLPAGSGAASGRLLRLLRRFGLYAGDGAEDGGTDPGGGLSEASKKTKQSKGHRRSGMYRARSDCGPAGEAVPYWYAPPASERCNHGSRGRRGYASSVPDVSGIRQRLSRLACGDRERDCLS